MTHRVRCHTSTGCLIAALWTMSTWVKWTERLSAVRWVEETVLPLIWLSGWILRSWGQSGSLRVSMPAQFYSWGAFLTIDAGGHRGAPNGTSFEWHLKPQNVAECGHWNKCTFFLSFWSLSFVVITKPSKQHDLTQKFYCNVSLWQVYGGKIGWRKWGISKPKE